MKVAILADIHANCWALEQVVQDLQKQECECAFILGDIIGYYYWPKKVLETLSDLEKSLSQTLYIKGNHEVLLAGALKDKNNLANYGRKYGTALEVCQEQLSVEQLEWLINLPEQQDLEIDDMSMKLVHGTTQSVDEYLYPDASINQLQHATAETNFLFYGHTHYPTIILSGQTTMVNPGSVGQPRDFGSLASYLVFNTSNRSLSHRRVAFDGSAIVSAAKERDADHPYLWKILARNNVLAKQ